MNVKKTTVLPRVSPGRIREFSLALQKYPDPPPGIGPQRINRCDAEPQLARDLRLLLAGQLRNEYLALALGQRFNGSRQAFGDLCLHSQLIRERPTVAIELGRQPAVITLRDRIEGLVEDVPKRGSFLAVDYCAADPKPREWGKVSAAWLKAINRLHQADVAGLDQVLKVRMSEDPAHLARYPADRGDLFENQRLSL